MFRKLRPALGIYLKRSIFQKRRCPFSKIFLSQQRCLSTVSNLWQQYKLDNKINLFQEVTLNNTENCIEIRWSNDESKSKYPYVWLRDNCQCPMCFDPSAQSRTMMIDNLNLKIKGLSTKIIEGQNLQIDWSDDHQSIFSADWLKSRSFDKKTQKSRAKLLKLEKIFWGSESFDNIPRIKYGDLLGTDEGILEWLQNLEIYGFVFILEAPAEYGIVRKLSERVAFVRRTHYGEEFSVKAKSDPSNVAYSSGPLQLHSDLPYYKYKPGAQLIHCIEQFPGKGGDSLVADAMNVAHQFKKNNPDQFKILTDIVVDWCDIGQENGKEFYKILQQPIICLDASGEIERINFSQPQRDSFFNTSFDNIAEWYKAYKDFFTSLNASENCLNFKMIPGTIQSFDNLRIVHGRTGYDATVGNREIEGCYIDWDEIRSKRRALQLKLK